LGALFCGRLAQTHAATTAASRRSFPHASHSGEHRDDAFEKLVRPGCLVAEHESQGLQSIDDGGAFAWGKAGFARLSPSWEGLGTLSGFPFD
jgi:hypothetical protein